FNGRTVHDITVNGLKRTKRKVVDLLTKTKSGRPFDAHQFWLDLQALFNTGNLYDLTGDVEDDGNGGVNVTINLKDKWTLLPAAGAQGGGGSSTVGGGVVEQNFLGYMAYASAFFWTFNGANSYEINLNQEYWKDTQTMWAADWQDNTEVQSPHYTNGQPAGLFAWRRQQKEIMLGTHTTNHWRIYGYMSIYKDSVFEN